MPGDSDTPVKTASPWIHPRRKRFWAIVAVLAYTLGGFFGIPAVVKSQLIDTLREDFGREAQVEEVAFNPFTLEMRIAGFQLDDVDGEGLAGFDELRVNFQLSSLFRRAWTFSELHLDAPWFHFERFAPGDSRIGRLLTDAKPTDPEAPTSNGEGGLPRLLIHDLRISDGRARFRDHVPEPLVELDAGPVDVAVDTLNTLPDRDGQQSVTIRLPGNGVLGWQGTIALSPLLSRGRLTVDELPLDPVTPYLQASLPLDALRARLSVHTSYRLGVRDTGDLEVMLDELEIGVDDFLLSGLAPSTDILAFTRLNLAGGSFRFPERRLHFVEIGLDGPGVKTWLDRSGRLNLLDLVPAGAGEPGEAAPDRSAEAAGWEVGADRLTVTGGALEFEDRRLDPPAAAALRELSLNATEPGNQPDQAIPVQLETGLDAGGRIRFDGSLTALPVFRLEGEVGIEELPLSLGQPYLEQRFRMQIEEGLFGTRAALNVQADGQLSVSGEVAVDRLQVLNTAADEPLLGWTRLLIDRFELDTAERSLALARLAIEEPTGRLQIRADKTTNLSDLPIAVVGEAPAETQPPEAPPWSVIVSGIGISDGFLAFSDLSLPLPFGTEISGLGGEVTAIDRNSTEPARLRFEGQVDDYGLARIEGSMRVFDPIGHTDVSVEFRNLLMSNLSPYTAQFAGREIDQGKLDLDLRYFIDQGALQGQNDIVLSDLVLGAEVDHPDAASLPLGLAVALLKDANGVIDIDLPVEGDVNDPEFRIGGVILKAIVGLITKVVTAPFSLLGNLIGVDSEELGAFQFLAGRSDLTPPEREKVAQLQSALAQRPELVLEIAGSYNAEVDGPRLRYDRLRQEVIERLGRELGSDATDQALIAEDVRPVLEALYSERIPDQTLDTVKAAHTRPPADDPEEKPQLDELAYAGALRDRLLAAETVSPADLEQLAEARAAAIRDAFIADGLEEARIRMAPPIAAESEDGEWVPLELGLATP